MHTQIYKHVHNNLSYINLSVEHKLYGVKINVPQKHTECAHSLPIRSHFIFVQTICSKWPCSEVDITFLNGFLFKLA